MTTYSEVSALILSKLGTGSDITAAEHRAVEQALLAFARDQWLEGDIKEIDCTNQYISLNFDANGIGIVGGEREGWAICNGYNNLTKDRTGRVSVGYGTVQPPGIDGIQTYPTVGAIGGSKDAVLIAHSHAPQQLNGSTPSSFYQTSWANPGGTPAENGGYAPGGIFNSDPAGGFRRTTLTAPAGSGDGIGKNMQPFIVTLFIQKLANPIPNP